MLQSTECFHTVHLQCFRARALQALIDNQPLTCPTCHKSVSDQEKKAYLDESEIKDIEKRQLDQFIGNQQNMAKCPDEACGYMIEVAQGQVDYNSKDDAGSVMSPAACIHMSKYRVKCRGCEKTYCHGCGVSPYHAGKNCEEYQRFLNAKKCRFCGAELAI